MLCPSIQVALKLVNCSTNIYSILGKWQWSVWPEFVFSWASWQHNYNCLCMCNSDKVGDTINAIEYWGCVIKMIGYTMFRWWFGDGWRFEDWWYKISYKPSNAISYETLVVVPGRIGTYCRYHCIECWYIDVYHIEWWRMRWRRKRRIRIRGSIPEKRLAMHGGW